MRNGKSCKVNIKFKGFLINYEVNQNEIRNIIVPKATREEMQPECQIIIYHLFHYLLIENKILN